MPLSCQQESNLQRAHNMSNSHSERLQKTTKKSNKLYLHHLHKIGYIYIVINDQPSEYISSLKNDIFHQDKDKLFDI